MNQRTKTVRQRKKEAKTNSKQLDPENHVSLARVPRLKKNKLADPPTATAKYKKRQVNKTWLPTHLWHTKRAHMTQATEPLWRMAIPLSPTEKSYRPSHRAAGSKGCIAWDTSYMSTVACWGTESALDSMLRSLNFCPQGLTQTLHKKWKSGTRFAEGWISERDNGKRPIAPVTILWSVRSEKVLQTEKDVPVADRPKMTDQMEIDNSDQRQGPTKETPTKRKSKLDYLVLVRIHPSAFHQVWQELLKVAKMQKPQVLIEDLRFEIGSIDIQGPGSTESLLGVLKPLMQVPEADDPIPSLWISLAGLNNPGILPYNATLAFDIVDPRLNHPPKQMKLPSDSDSSLLNQAVLSWPADKPLATSRLLSHKIRWQVSNALPSQKAINRRRAIAPPGQVLLPSPKDPRIPVILLASRAHSSSTSRGGNSQGTWTVLLPWSCVDPVWRSLMYYPLSSGGTPRFGGLRQTQQMAFEQRVPWFPGDFPGTEAGKAWERTEGERRFDDWIRRPPKSRIHWDKLDIGLGRYGEVGSGWTRDWEYLFENTAEPPQSGLIQVSRPAPDVSLPVNLEAKPILTQRQRKAAKAKTEHKPNTEELARRRNTSSPESDAEPLEVQAATTEIRYSQLLPTLYSSILRHPSSSSLPPNPVLMTVRITLLDKGTPLPTARIYRLPSLPNKHSNDVAPPADETSQATEPQSWSSAPPPGQNPPATGTTDRSTSSSVVSVRSLRTRWLSLDPQLEFSSPVSKVKTNRSNVPRRQSAYPRESLAKINVLPKNAPQEIVEKYGPNSAFGRGDGDAAKGASAPAKTRDPKATRKDKDIDKGSSDLVNAADPPNPYFDRDDVNADISDLLFKNPDAPSPWTKHPPCPDARDLLGFVTSGGYNLAEGYGTAVGSLWVQRVVEGWAAEREQNSHSQREQVSGDGKTGSGGKGSSRDKALQDRQKRLCIVRNAGESIARLGIWEACG